MGSLRNVDAANCRAVNCGTSVHFSNGGVMLRESLPSNMMCYIVLRRLDKIQREERRIAAASSRPFGSNDAISLCPYWLAAVSSGA